MTPADCIDLYRYTEWANERMRTAILALSPEDRERDLGTSFRSVRGTFVHIISGEWIWLERWFGRNPSAPPVWLKSTDLDELTAVLRDVEARRQEFLASVRDADLDQSLSFTFLNGTPGSHRLGDLLVHVANHSTFHRGQVMSMIRQLGAAPPATDFIVFRTENPQA